MLKYDAVTGEWIYKLNASYCLVGYVTSEESRKIKFEMVESRFYKMKSLVLNDRTEIFNPDNFKWISKLLLSLRYYADVEELMRVCQQIKIIYSTLGIVVIRKYSDRIYSSFCDKKIKDQMFLFQRERFEDGVEYECVGPSDKNITMVCVKNAFDEKVVVPIECCEPVRGKFL